MDRRSPTFEATLLYERAFTMPAEELSEILNPILREHGESIVVCDRIDDSFTLFSGNTVQILLAFSDQPLPLNTFIDPQCSLTAPVNQKLMAALTVTNGSVTVLVMNRRTTDRASNQAGTGLKRSICWEILREINAYRGANLVFWANDETLYTHDEFDFACLNHAALGEDHQLPDHANLCAREDLPDFLRSDPEVSDAAWSHLERHIPTMPDPEPSAEARPLRSPLETMLSYANPVQSRWEGHETPPPPAYRAQAALLGTMALGFVLATAKPLGLLDRII